MILYIGNKLSKYGNTPTSVEILGKLLSEEIEVVTVSDKQNKVLRMFDMLWSVIKYRKDISFLLIDTYSTTNFYYALFNAILAKLFNIAYIPILHGGDLEKRLKYFPKMSKIIFLNAYVNIAPSGYLKSVFEKYGYVVKFIPNNIEIENYIFKQRKNVQPKLFYVRAFSTLYNPSMALYVLKILLEKYENATLCMVGPDREEMLPQLKQLAKDLGIEQRILFTGKLSKKEWWKLSREYDIFINTTNFDNTPVSVIEAMALGLPVVSTNVGGIPYLVEDGKEALLVDASDTQNMVEKISYLVENNQEAEQIIDNARKKAESFDWKNVKKQWIALLKGDQ